MNILSLDWDYFFPDNFDFDWQMNEARGIYFELIWHLRWGNVNLKTKQLAKDTYLPNLKLYNQFINKVFNQCNPLLITIADSHSAIGAVFDSLNFVKKFSIWNFDQHHDFWYGEMEFPEYDCDCGNWVKFHWNKIQEYHLIYPNWRKSFPEGNIKKYQKHFNSINYSIPKHLPDFDVIFVCRSSAWTPSWSDNHWIDLINSIRDRFPETWQHGRIQNDFAMRAREFNRIEAEELYQQSINLMKGN